jgi:DHA1 family tetracycline resistance protein-like MFS transporter
VTYRYGWGASAIGLSLAAVGVTSVVAQAVIVRPYVKRFGERFSLVSGLTFGAIGLVICGIAPSGPLFFAGLPFLSLWGLAGASAQSLMTRAVTPAQQGELQGTINSIRGVAALIGPILFTSAFGFGIAAGRNIPGAAWFAGAVLLLLALAATPTVKDSVAEPVAATS